MGESPADDLCEDPPEKVPNTIPALSNPFIESDEEEDTTVCSVIEKSESQLGMGSPWKKIRSSASAERCGSVQNKEMDSSLNSEESIYSKDGSFNCKKTSYHSKSSNFPKAESLNSSSSRRDLLSLPLQPPSLNGHWPDKKEEMFDCPMCKYTDSDPERLQDHVNRLIDGFWFSNNNFSSSRIHLDHTSPASQSVSSCPMCPASFSNPTLLQSHFNSSHPDLFTPSPTSSVGTCPVCGDTGWSVDQLQVHVESHFSGDTPSEVLTRENEIKDQAKRKREEEVEFASLQAQYGMVDDQGNFRSQSASGLRKAVVSGKLSVVDYYERSAGLAESQKSGIDDGSSVTLKITLLIRGLSQGSHGVVDTLLASRTDHYASTFGDKGWGCGFRNLQMILSALLHSTLYRDVVMAAAVGNRNLGKSVGVPSIPRLQQVIEEAWRAGFDRAGCEQLGGRLVNSRKWIGATEIATFLSFCHIDSEILDFHAPTAANGTHPRLFDWVVSYFRQTRSLTPPLYLQHQGHSRTIVGAEMMAGGAVRLLILDPSHSPANLGENTMRLVRKTLLGMRSKQYQIVAVTGKLDSAQNREAKKVIASRRIP